MIKAYRFDADAYHKQWEENITEFFATFTVRRGIELTELSQKNRWVRTFPEPRQAQLMDTLLCNCPLKTVQAKARKDLYDYLVPDRTPFWVQIDPSEVPAAREYLVCENGEMIEMLVKKYKVSREYTKSKPYYPIGE